MAYRRKPQPLPLPQPQPTPSFEHNCPPSVGPASPDSLAAQAMRASAAHRDASSYSSSASLAASRWSHHEPSVSTPSPDCSGYEYTSMKTLNEAKYGFWVTLARKAKSFLDKDCSPEQYKSPRERDDVQVGVQLPHSKQLPGETGKPETPPSQKRSESITSSLTYIGGTIKNACWHGKPRANTRELRTVSKTKTVS